MIKTRKAQSTLEYIVVFTAIVVAILALTYSRLQPAIQGVLESSATRMDNTARDFRDGNLYSE